MPVLAAQTVGQPGTPEATLPALPPSPAGNTALDFTIGGVRFHRGGMQIGYRFNLGGYSTILNTGGVDSDGRFVQPSSVRGYGGSAPRNADYLAALASLPERDDEIVRVLAEIRCPLDYDCWNDSFEMRYTREGHVRSYTAREHLLIRINELRETVPGVFVRPNFSGGYTLQTSADGTPTMHFSGGSHVHRSSTGVIITTSLPPQTLTQSATWDLTRRSPVAIVATARPIPLRPPTVVSPTRTTPETVRQPFPAGLRPARRSPDDSIFNGAYTAIGQVLGVSHQAWQIDTLYPSEPDRAFTRVQIQPLLTAIYLDAPEVSNRNITDRYFFAVSQQGVIQVVQQEVRDSVVQTQRSWFWDAMQAVSSPPSPDGGYRAPPHVDTSEPP